MASEVATLAGGCFWCTEAVFKDVIGVEGVESGYIGGTVPNPTYKQVCGGDTGHAEAIRVTFDTDQVSYVRNTARRSSHIRRNRQAQPRPRSRAPRPTGPRRSSRRSSRLLHGIRRRITIRIIGTPKAAAIPIASR